MTALLLCAGRESAGSGDMLGTLMPGWRAMMRVAGLEFAHRGGEGGGRRRQITHLGLGHGRKGGDGEELQHVVGVCERVGSDRGKITFGSASPRSVQYLRWNMSQRQRTQGQRGTAKRCCLGTEKRWQSIRGSPRIPVARQTGGGGAACTGTPRSSNV